MIRILTLIILCLTFASKGFGQCHPTISKSGSHCVSDSLIITVSGAGSIDSVKAFHPDLSDSIKSFGTFLFPNGLTATNRNIAIRVYSAQCSAAHPEGYLDTSINYAVSSPGTFSINISNSGNCANDSLSFSSNFSGVSYFWKFTDGSSTLDSSILSSPKLIFPTQYGDGISTLTAILQITESTGCRIQNSSSFTVKQIPDPTLYESHNPGAANFKLCSGLPDSLELYNISTTYSTNINYHIDWGDGQAYDSSQFNNSEKLTHFYTANGSYSLTYKILGSNGCLVSNSHFVFKGTNPAVSFGSPGNTTNLCVGTMKKFPIMGFENNTTETTYRVFVDDGSNDTVFTHPPPGTFDHIFQSPSCIAGGLNRYTAYIKAINQCDTTPGSIGNITVVSPPKAKIDHSDSVFCITDTVSLIDSTDRGQNISGSNCVEQATSRYWTVTPSAGFTLQSGSNLGNSSALPGVNNPAMGSANLKIKFNVAGTYLIRLIVKNNLCGLDTATISICIQQSNIIPNLTISSDSICVNNSISTSNLTEVTNAFCRVPQYFWTLSRTSESCPNNSASNPSFISGTTSASKEPQISFANPGVYTLTSRITDVCGSRDTSLKIVVKDKPQLQLPAVNPVCTDTSISPVVSINNCHSSDTLSYAWTFKNGTPATSSNPFPTNIYFNTLGTNADSISVSVTNECGTNKTAVGFSIYSTPSPSAGLDTSFCSGDTIQIGSLPQASVTYQWIPSTGILNPTSSNPKTTLQNNGSTDTTIQYVIRGTLANCIVYDTIQLVVKPKPTTPSIANTAICTGDSTTLIYNGLGLISWFDTEASSTAIDVSNSFVVKPAATKTYFAQASFNGCTQLKRDSVTVTVKPLPAPNAGLDTSTCSNSGIQIGTNTSASYKYKWSPSAGLSSDSAMRSIVTLSNPLSMSFDSTYILTATLNGCSRQDSVRIRVHPLPEIPQIADTTICQKDTATLNYSGMHTIKWFTSSTGGVPFSLQNQIKISPALSTSYFAESSTIQCTNPQRDSIKITVNNLPVVITEKDTAICISNGPRILNANLSGGIWSSTNSALIGNIFDPSISGSGSFSFYYKYTDANSCFSGDSLKLRVDSISTAKAGPDMTTCSSVGVKIGSLPASATVTYFWSPSINLDNSLSANPTATIPNTTGGDLIRDYIVTAINGRCSSIDTVTVTVKSSPTPPSFSPISICNGDSAALTYSGSGSVSWYDGATGGPVLSTSNPYIVKPSASKIYYGEASLTGCTQAGRGSLSVTVKPLPQAKAGNDTSICSGVNITIGSTSTTGYTYQWNPTTGLSSAAVSNPNITLINPTNTPYDSLYTVTATLSGCKSSDTIKINVKPSAEPAIISDTAICLNGIATLIYTGPDSVKWFSSPTGPTLISTSDTLVRSPVTTTTYYADAFKSSCAQQVRTPVKVIINQLPTVTIEPDFAICISDSLRQLNTNVSGGTWSDLISISPTGIFDPSIATSGNHKYSYSYTDANQCSSTDSIIIHVDTLIFANAGQDTTICSSTLGFIGTSPSIPGIQYKWSPNIGLNTPNSSATNVSLVNISGIPQNYLYELKLTNGACTTRDSVLVIVNPEPPAPVFQNQTICFGDTTTLKYSGIGNIEWFDTLANGNKLSIDNPYFIFPKINTIYFGQASLNGCTQSQRGRILVTVNPLPIINAGVDTTICNQPIPVKYSALPSGGYWGNTPEIDSAGLFTPNGIGVFTTVYTYTHPVTSCTNSDTIEIQVEAPVFPDAGIDFEICHNTQPKQLQGTPTLPNGKWQTTGQITSTGLFEPNTVGAYQLVYDLATGNCLTHDTLLAVVHGLPSVNAGIDLSRCYNSADTLLQPIFPSGGYWTGSGIDSIGLFTSSTGVGSHTQTYTFIDSNSCLNSDTRIITVNPLPPINVFAMDTTICNQSIEVKLMGAPSGGFWYGSGIKPTGRFSSATTGTFVVNYTSKNSFGCWDTASKNIHVIDAMFPNAGSDLTICEKPGTIQLNGGPILPDGRWEITPMVTANGVFDCSIPGTYEAVFAIGQGNCETHDTITIVVNPIPAVNAGSDIQICQNAPDTLLKAITPNGGTWSGVGVSSNGLFTPSTGVNSYTITYTVTTNAQCINFDSRIITVNPKPILNVFASDTTICNTKTPVYFTGSPAGGTWFGDSRIDVLGKYSPAGTGVFPVKYTIMNQFGCRDTAIKTLHIVAPTNISANGDGQLCSGGNAFNLIGTPTNGTWSGNPHISSNGSFNPVVPGSFLAIYTLGSGNCQVFDTAKISVLQSPTAAFSVPPLTTCIKPIIFTPKNNSQFATGFTWIVDGIYYYQFEPAIILQNVGPHTIQLIADVQNLCFNSTTQIVTPVQPITAAFDIKDTICQEQILTPVNKSTGALTYEWYLNRVLISTEKEPLIPTKNAGDYSLQLVIRNTSCVDSLENPKYFKVGTPPIPGFTIHPETVTLNDQKLTLDCDASGYQTAIYETGGFVFDSCNSEIETTFKEPGVYPILQTLTSAEGCPVQAIRYFTIVSEDGIFVPTAFTPDGDGRNDNFSPVLFGYRNYEFWIYDRWGKVIFHTLDRNETWNGTDLNVGIECRSDVYHWRVVTDDMYGNRKDLSGVVTLIK